MQAPVHERVRDDIHREAVSRGPGGHRHDSGGLARCHPPLVYDGDVMRDFIISLGLGILVGLAVFEHLYPCVS